MVGVYVFHSVHEDGLRFEAGLLPGSLLSSTFYQFVLFLRRSLITLIERDFFTRVPTREGPFFRIQTPGKILTCKGSSFQPLKF